MPKRCCEKIRSLWPFMHLTLVHVGSADGRGPLVRVLFIQALTLFTFLTDTLELTDRQPRPPF